MAGLPLSEEFLILPPAFPHTTRPKFQIGDRVQWQPKPTRDFGIITGIHFAPAPHLQTWAWQYTVWLDAESPSRSWVSADIAWETDLEAISVTSGNQTSQERDR